MFTKSNSILPGDDKAVFCGVRHHVLVRWRPPQGCRRNPSCFTVAWRARGCTCSSFPQLLARRTGTSWDSPGQAQRAPTRSSACLGAPRWPPMSRWWGRVVPAPRAEGQLVWARAGIWITWVRNRARVGAVGTVLRLRSPKKPLVHATAHILGVWVLCLS